MIYTQLCAGTTAIYYLAKAWLIPVSVLAGIYIWDPEFVITLSHLLQDSYTLGTIAWGGSNGFLYSRSSVS